MIAGPSLWASTDCERSSLAFADISLVQVATSATATDAMASGVILTQDVTLVASMSKVVQRVHSLVQIIACTRIQMTRGVAESALAQMVIQTIPGDAQRSYPNNLLFRKWTSASAKPLSLTLQANSISLYDG